MAWCIVIVIPRFLAIVLQELRTEPPYVEQSYTEPSYVELPYIKPYVTPYLEP